jgi:uncharacterized protein (DUF1810 family)
MTNENNLKRFINAQEISYSTALSEIKKGQKISHWMWYIFPQIQGLGFSETSKKFAIKNLTEAEAFLNHPLLGNRLVEISNALLQLPGHDAHKIFGTPDDLKLKSSMTLFASLGVNSVFDAVLKKYFNGNKDQKTLQIIEAQQ